MVCFERKEEAIVAIQNLNETTRYIAKEYEPIKQRINISSQDKTHIITAKEKGYIITSSIVSEHKF